MLKARAQLDWSSDDVMGLDVGDVLSKKGFTTQWDPPYKSADPGAVPFLVFFKLQYDAKLRLVSRVNHVKKSWYTHLGEERWHWVM